MTKIFKSLFLILLSCTFMSCDPGLINKYVIENNSNYDIKVVTKLNQSKRSIQELDSIKTFFIKKGEKREIISYGEIGRAYDKNDQFLESIDSLYITNENKKIKIDYLLRNYWNYKILNRGYLSTAEVEYILKIRNTDIK